MTGLLRAKYDQHPELAEILVATDDATLIYDDVDSAFWGITPAEAATGQAVSSNLSAPNYRCDEPPFPDSRRTRGGADSRCRSHCATRCGLPDGSPIAARAGAAEGERQALLGLGENFPATIVVQEPDPAS